MPPRHENPVTEARLAILAALQAIQGSPDFWYSVDPANVKSHTPETVKDTSELVIYVWTEPGNFEDHTNGSVKGNLIFMVQGVFHNSAEGDTYLVRERMGEDMVQALSRITVPASCQTLLIETQDFGASEADVIWGIGTEAIAKIGLRLEYVEATQSEP